jgi:hypothetical protein
MPPLAIVPANENTVELSTDSDSPVTSAPALLAVREPSAAIDRVTLWLLAASEALRAATSSW